MCYESVPSISKTRVYYWIKAYDKFGLEGIKWKADERRLGKGDFAQVNLQTKKGEVTSVRDLIIGAHLNAPHYKAKMLYKQLIQLAKRVDVAVPSYRTVCRQAKINIIVKRDDTKNIISLMLNSTKLATSWRIKFCGVISKTLSLTNKII